MVSLRDGTLVGPVTVYSDWVRHGTLVCW